MTEQIKSAIADFQEWIDRAKEFNPDIESDHVKAMKVSIRSLQAWEEVLQELEENRKGLVNTEYDLGVRKGIGFAINIINQHLAEIEE